MDSEWLWAMWNLCWAIMAAKTCFRKPGNLTVWFRRHPSDSPLRRRSLHGRPCAMLRPCMCCQEFDGIQNSSHVSLRQFDKQHQTAIERLSGAILGLHWAMVQAGSDMDQTMGDSLRNSYPASSRGAAVSRPSTQSHQVPPS